MRRHDSDLISHKRTLSCTENFVQRLPGVLTTTQSPNENNSLRVVRFDLRISVSRCYLDSSLRDMVIFVVKGLDLLFDHFNDWINYFLEELFNVQTFSS